MKSLAVGISKYPSGFFSSLAIEARMIRCELRRQLLDFEADVREYLEMEDGEDKEDLYCRIRQELSNRSEYTAFKRWLILDHKEMCRDLLPLLERP